MKHRTLDKNTIFTWLKWIVVVGILIYIYYLIQQHDMNSIVSEFKTKLSTSNVLLLICAICLMPINWLLESIKWKVLIHHIHPTSLRQAIKSVITGVSTSMLTPNRIGDFGGKIMYLPAEKRYNGTIASFIGSTSQTLLLVIIGMISSILFLKTSLTDTNWILNSVVIGIYIPFAMILLWLYFNPKRVFELLALIPILKKHSEKWAYMKDVSKETLVNAIGLSFLRIVVYSLQYILILYFFGLDSNLWIAMMCVGVLFFIQTIPIPPFLSLPVRIASALSLLSLYGMNELSITTATFGLWVLNVVIPALIGTLFICIYRITKN